MDVIRLFEDPGAAAPAASEADTPVDRALGQVLAEIDQIAKATFGSITLATMLGMVERAAKARRHEHCAWRRPRPAHTRVDPVTSGTASCYDFYARSPRARYPQFRHPPLPVGAAAVLGHRQRRTERLAKGCQLRRFERGEMVFRMGEPCDSFHVVVVGQVKLFVISPSGQEKVIELVSPGASFAEALMFLGKPYLVNAQALADSLLLTVQRQAVLAETGARQPLRAAHAGRPVAPPARPGARRAGLCAAQRRAARGRLPAARPGLRGRPRGDARTVSLPVSKATVASRLSLTPEYFSRVLRELETAGLIEVDKRDIRILDGKQLAAYRSG